MRMISTAPRLVMQKLIQQHQMKVARKLQAAVGMQVQMRKKRALTQSCHLHQVSAFTLLISMIQLKTQVSTELSRQQHRSRLS